MGIPGRKPKPNELKLLEGNPGKRRIRRGSSPTGRPKMPVDLLPAAEAEWKRVVPGLIKLGLATKFDQVALADYCTCVARLEQCEKALSEHGLLVQGERGLVKNPAAQMAREYRVSIMKWCAEFGLTPSARGRMSLPEPKNPNDPFAEFED